MRVLLETFLKCGAGRQCHAGRLNLDFVSKVYS
jgi:hypothetical protein